MTIHIIIYNMIRVFPFLIEDLNDIELGQYSKNPTSCELVRILGRKAVFCSPYSRCSFVGMYSCCSCCSCIAFFSFLSMASFLSIGSIFSVGSIFSLYSVNSFLCIGCVGDMLNVCGYYSALIQ